MKGFSMKTYKFSHRAVALLCAVVMLLASVPFAAAEGPLTISVGTASTTPGNSFYMYLYVGNAEALGLLELDLYYDTSALTLVNSYAYNTMDSVYVKEAAPGAVSVMAMDADGVTTSGFNLVRLYFQVNSDAETEKTYPVQITVDMALNKSYQPLDVSIRSGSVTVNKPSAPTAWFYWSGPSTVTAGEDVTVDIYANSLGGMVTGKFAFTYNDDYFTFKSLTPASSLQREGDVWYVSSSNSGVVTASWVGSSVPYTGTMMQLTLTAKENVTGAQTVVCTPGEMYNAAGTAITASSVQKSITIEERVLDADLPDFYFEGDNILLADSTVTFTAAVEGRSALAAADFDIFYDGDVLEFVSAKPLGSGNMTGEQQNVTVLTNHFASENRIRISMICNGGLTQNTELAQLQWKAKENTLAETEITATVSGNVNTAFAVVPLEMKTAEISVIPRYQVTFVNDDGSMLSQQTVTYQESAVAPTARKEPDEQKHYTFSGWDSDFSKVESNLTVKAQYTAADHTVSGWSPVSDTLHGGTCSVCTMNLTESHDWDDGSVTTLPTCTELGVKTYACVVCKKTRTKPVDALGHTEVVDEAVAPTCTATGLTEGKHCSVCDEVLIAQEVVPALGHKYEAVITDPTCTAEGYTTNTCSVCGDTYVDAKTDALGHTEVVDEAVAPTCTETGLTEGKHCSVCDEVLIAQEVVSALGHKYEAVITDPTCTAEGYTTNTCSVCGDTYVDAKTDALGHREETIPGKKPTYWETGLTEGVLCKVCDEILVEQEIAPILVPAVDEHDILELIDILPDVKQVVVASYDAQGKMHITVSLRPNDDSKVSLLLTDMKAASYLKIFFLDTEYAPVVRNLYMDEF